MQGDATLVEVRLLNLPLQVRALFVQHTEGLMRELALVQLEAKHEAAEHPQTSPQTLSPRLLQLAAELAETYAPFQAQPAAVIAAALAAGKDSCDVTYTLPHQIESFMQRVAQLLDEADDFCRREEHLLTLPAPLEVTDYRRWLFGEFQRQLSGQAPRPWHRRHSATAATTPPATAAPGRAAAPLPPAGEEEAVAARPRKSDAGETVGQPLVMESLASSVAHARRHVRQVLRHLGREALEETAELGVSELVSNAVLHARTPFTLTVRSMPSGRVRIEVDDSSPVLLQPRHFDTMATTGRGLQLVGSLSFDWGIEVRTDPLTPGKTVWFEPQEITGEVDGMIDFNGGDWDLKGLR